MNTRDQSSSTPWDAWGGERLKVGALEPLQLAPSPTPFPSLINTFSLSSTGVDGAWIPLSTVDAAPAQSACVALWMLLVPT